VFDGNTSIVAVFDIELFVAVTVNKLLFVDEKSPFPSIDAPEPFTLQLVEFVSEIGYKVWSNPLTEYCFVCPNVIEVVDGVTTNVVKIGV
jgi:hypothetical protein